MGFRDAHVTYGHARRKSTCGEPDVITSQISGRHVVDRIDAPEVLGTGALDISVSVAPPKAEAGYGRALYVPHYTRVDLRDGSARSCRVPTSRSRPCMLWTCIYIRTNARTKEGATIGHRVLSMRPRAAAVVTLVRETYSILGHGKALTPPGHQTYGNGRVLRSVNCSPRSPLRPTMTSKPRQSRDGFGGCKLWALSTVLFANGRLFLRWDSKVTPNK